MTVSTTEFALTGFVVVMLVAQLISLKLKLPYTMILVFLGIGITALSTLPLLGSNPVSTGMRDVITLASSAYSGLVQGGLFVGIVVPPLIFEAMMNIRAPDLRAVIRPAIILATGGVVIATLVASVILIQLAGMSLVVSVLFAALIAPTDVVTVLEVFRRAPVPSKLATLMDTEAAFNDATAIVVFSIILSSLSLGSVPILSSILLFGYTTLGGAAVGLLTALWAKRISGTFEDRIAEITLTIAAVYGSYVFATGLGMSGLIAVAIVGLYFGNVTMSSTRPEVKEAVLSFWQFAAFLGNSVAFLLIGFVTDLVALSQSIIVIVGAYLAVTIARAASVYPILAFFNQIGEEIPLAWSNVAMLGGVRGALSIALAASLTVSSFLSGSDVHTITTLVLGVAFLSIAIQTPLLLRYITKMFGSQQTLERSASA
ncbi:MAG: cation:proton antiporter [Thaumarchaeota archaeon]|nr:cation:proton antiporter [Nitrososphaerota archaeon]